jgi:hypothetical protein
MPLSAADYQAQVTSQLSLSDTLAAEVPTVWDLYADKALIVGGGPRLQYLYAKRHFLDVLLGAAATDTDYEEGVTRYSLSQVSKQLAQMRAMVEAEIRLIESRACGNQAPQVAQLTTMTPNPAPPAGVPDPNDSRYKGDPLKRLTTPFGF